MSRVLFVVAACLCIALSCAAQKNEWRYGGGPSAVTLDAPNDEQKKKIVEAKRANLQVRSQVQKLTASVHQLGKYCDSAVEHLNQFQQAAVSMQSYVDDTKKYFKEFTGLGVEQDLKKLEQAASEVNSQNDQVLKSQKDVCDSSKQFSDKVSEVDTALGEAEAAVSGLETTYTDELLEEAKRKTESVQNDAEKLSKDAEKTINTNRKKTEGIESVSTAVVELRAEIENVFLDVKKVYDKCYNEFMAKVKRGPPDNQEYVERMRLETCQKKEDSSSNSKKSDNEESKETQPPTTIEPKPDSDSKETQPPTTIEPKPDSDSKETQPPTTIKPNNDGDARFAVLQNIFFACLFVAGLSVLTTA